MSTNFTVSNYLTAHARLAQQLNADAFQKGIEMVKAAYEGGKKIITCGNGGSASYVWAYGHENPLWLHHKVNLDQIL
jgi:phosphoheptose isomerase